ncbi:MAG: hypothetical protein H6811_04945 [Phycisphaeraceae bacterium]|nr:hypothetical protein [Phycisphaeraceae bacterium]
MAITLDSLLPNLAGLRKTGEARWTALCPAHDDRTPSLSVFADVPDDIDTPLADRGAYSQTAYSQRGLTYRTRIAIAPTESDPGSSSGFLETHAWFDEVETRAHNSANEITDLDTSGVSSTSQDLRHGKAGNLTRTKNPANQAGTRYVHDAWNRLVRIDTLGTSGTPAADPSAYEYNGLHWRTVRQGLVGGDLQTRVMYYSAAWQLIEEHIDDDEDLDPDRIAQQFWGLRYIDDAVCRRIDADADGEYDDPGDATFFHITDVQFSSVAMIDDAANLVERVVYDAYGRARHQWPLDVDGDGDVDSADDAIMDALSGSFPIAITSGSYNADADIDRDGDVDADDAQAVTDALTTAALAFGQLSDPAGPDNPIGYDGYVFNATDGTYTVRFRTYFPELGRWGERDPICYVSSMSLYLYGHASPHGYADPSGLDPFDDLIKHYSPPPPSLLDFTYRPGHNWTPLQRIHAAFYDSYTYFSTEHRRDLSLFLDAQACILEGAIACANPCGTSAGGTVAANERWLNAVIADFMRPLINSLGEYGTCGDVRDISDGGWQLFFADYLAGRYDSRVAEGGIRQIVKFHSGRVHGLDVYSAADFLVLKRHRVAHAMALNHINNDLRNALLKNGPGDDDVWDCIGNLVFSCQLKLLSPSEQTQMRDAISKVPELNVSWIRDEMRRRVIEILDEQNR